MRWRRGRCTSDSCRLAAMPKSAASGQKRSFQPCDRRRYYSGFRSTGKGRQRRALARHDHHAAAFGGHASLFPPYDASIRPESRSRSPETVFLRHRYDSRKIRIALGAELFIGLLPHAPVAPHSGPRLLEGVRVLDREDDFHRLPPSTIRQCSTTGSFSVCGVRYASTTVVSFNRGLDLGPDGPLGITRKAIRAVRRPWALRGAPQARPAVRARLGAPARGRPTARRHSSGGIHD